MSIDVLRVCHAWSHHLSQFELLGVGVSHRSRSIDMGGWNAEVKQTKQWYRSFQKQNPTGLLACRSLVLSCWHLKAFSLTNYALHFSLPPPLCEAAISAVIYSSESQPEYARKTAAGNLSGHFLTASGSKEAALCPLTHGTPFHMWRICLSLLAHVSLGRAGMEEGEAWRSLLGWGNRES
jgi:hypothetical protein